MARTLDAIRWTPAQVREFTGRYLSEPKAHVFFTPPRKPLARTVFARRAAKSGLGLDARARLLYQGTTFFLNGEALDAPAPARAQRVGGEEVAGDPRVEQHDDHEREVHAVVTEPREAGAAPRRLARTAGA